MRFYVRSGAVMAVHEDAQVIQPEAYGAGVVAIVVPSGEPLPVRDASGQFTVPVLTAQVRTASIKDECWRRIMAKISETAQRNLTAYGVLLATLPTRSAEQDADLAALTAIFAWIGRPSGMQGAADSLIAAGATAWSDDVNWPAWNDDWNGLVARF